MLRWGICLFLEKYEFLWIDTITNGWYQCYRQFEQHDKIPRQFNTSGLFSLESINFAKPIICFFAIWPIY
jgi:hypothetical protein